MAFYTGRSSCTNNGAVRKVLVIISNEYGLNIRTCVSIIIKCYKLRTAVW